MEIIIALILGSIVGYFIKLNKKQKALNGKLQQLGVVFLLFSMGASIGANENIIADLAKIGIKAFSFATFTIFGSVILVFLLSNKFLKNSKIVICNEENSIKEKNHCTIEIMEDI